MFYPDTQIAKEIERQESLAADDMLELGELTDTKGGPGFASDYVNGEQFF